MEKGEKVYNRMRLWEFPDQYLVEPSDGSSAPFLAISRYTGSISLLDDVPQSSSLRAPRIWAIFGVVGILKLVTGCYLLVINERECAGYHLGRPVFRIRSMKIFPCNLSLRNAPEEQRKMEKEFSPLLNIAKTTPGLYFSYDLNITLSAQRQHDMDEESKVLPLWRRADPRFRWNSHISEMLIDNKLDPYLLPVMQGNVSRAFSMLLEKTFLLSHSLHEDATKELGMTFMCEQKLLSSLVDETIQIDALLLIDGTRMWTRGADSEGFVANFVETEQIMQCNGNFTSFVQVRGSIPFFWDQIVDLKYKPKFGILTFDEIPQVVEKHFLDLKKKYGNVLAVNLVNKHGDEGRLCQEFDIAMQHVANDNVRYKHFDFHKLCGELHIEWLSVLYYQIEMFLYRNRYFLLNEKEEKVERQVGVVRTNCIDCLDRTNVTQSMIARKTLESQLRRLGIFNFDETIIKHPKLDQCFKSLWANHGDDISIQYTGTPALKGDFVRFGTRTVQGILKDSWSSLMRYYLNNFRDGTKQDAIDLLQGHFISSACLAVTPATRNDSVEGIASFPLAFFVIMSGIFYAIVPLRRVLHDPWIICSSIMWGTMSYVVAMFVKANGRMFCDCPRLNQPRL